MKCNHVQKKFRSMKIMKSMKCLITTLKAENSKHRNSRIYIHVELLSEVVFRYNLIDRNGFSHHKQSSFNGHCSANAFEHL